MDWVNFSQCLRCLSGNFFFFFPPSAQDESSLAGQDLLYHKFHKKNCFNTLPNFGRICRSRIFGLTYP
jgi:hypothetical protein